MSQTAVPPSAGTTGAPRFGRLLTAMVTPFTADGALDLVAARRLAAHLVDDLDHDGLVVNGTTGEAPTTTAAEKASLLAAVVAEVGERAQVVAGVGSYDTAASQQLAGEAAEAGADGLLVVTPFYSRPTQAGLLAHFVAVAEHTPLPVVLYDIPHRAGTSIETSTLLELAAHPRVVALKDAKADLIASSRVSEVLDVYAGDDAMTLPLLSVGAVGVIGTSTHFSGTAMAELLDAWFAGDHARALRRHRELLDVFTGVFAAPGCAMVKAALARRGCPVGGVRLPMLEPEQAEVAEFAAQLQAAGLG